MSRIQRINSLYRLEKEGLYRIFIPPTIYHRYGIDPVSLCNERGERVARFFCPQGDRTCLSEIKLPEMEDPLFSLQLTDSTDVTQIELDFMVVNDPASQKYNTHVDSEGRDTLFGWASRNLVEEEKAMEAGLFPGQVRKGIGLTCEVIRILDFFCKMMGLKAVRLEALFYHNAITYERHGFGYFSGYRMMKLIHEGFQPGGKIFEKLNNSTPFRKPEFASTVRGRSWAIHDGILLDVQDETLVEGWSSPAMYRMVDNPRSMVTFPDPVY
jgi:hypothetical protein